MSEKSGRGVPATNVAPGATSTAMSWLPLLKNSSRPLCAQRGSDPPSRETTWVDAPLGNAVTKTSVFPEAGEA